MGDLGLLILLLIADSPVDATECCHPYCSEWVWNEGTSGNFRDSKLVCRARGGVGSSGVRKSGAVGYIYMRGR
jgi:hypothetical protein